MANTFFKLFYCGFNGYQHLPMFKKIVKIPIELQESHSIVKAKSGYHTLSIKEKNVFTIFMIDDEKHEKRIVFEKKSNDFICTEEGIIVCDGMKVMMSSLNSNVTWNEWNLVVEEDVNVWNEDGNSIKKLCLVHNLGLVVLLTNGSIWKIKHMHTSKMIYSAATEKAIDLVAGFEHALALTEGGCVLAFGCGSHGQLGFGDLNSTDLPLQVPAFDGIEVQKIAAAGWHSCAVSTTGDLYVWGWNTSGELGFTTDDASVLATPTPLELEFDVSDVSCGVRHTVITGNQQIYSAGWNSYGQLGLGSDEEKIEKFTKLSFECSVFKSFKVICGPWCTMILTENK